MKTFFGIAALLVIGLLAFVFWSPSQEIDEHQMTTKTMSDEEMAEQMADLEGGNGENGQLVVESGVYMIDTEASSLLWAGQKPLIDGYINTGSIAVKSGAIVVSDTGMTGDFTLDMNSLSVSATPIKPGKESMLEEHLKGERWFDVAGFPEATFTIAEVTPQSGEGFLYDVVGDLTIKGQTHEVTFPATIYTDNEGVTYAEATFGIDRTLWGITAGSSSFFDNLADNVVDDIVAMSFKLVARSQ